MEAPRARARCGGRSVDGGVRPGKALYARPLRRICNPARRSSQTTGASTPPSARFPRKRRSSAHCALNLILPLHLPRVSAGNCHPAPAPAPHGARGRDGVGPGPIRDRSGVGARSGSLWGQFGINAGSMRGRCGVEIVSMSGGSEVESGPLWGRSESNETGSFEDLPWNVQVVRQSPALLQILQGYTPHPIYLWRPCPLARSIPARPLAASSHGCRSARHEWRQIETQRSTSDEARGGVCVCVWRLPLMVKS